MVQGQIPLQGKLLERYRGTKATLTKGLRVNVLRAMIKMKNVSLSDVRKQPSINLSTFVSTCSRSKPSDVEQLTKITLP